MTMKDLWTKMDSDREARTRREQHGRGELTFLDGVPTNATGCLLPNGTFTDAECLVRHVAVPDATQRVWTRRLPGTVLRRRGRLKVDDGKALLFLDEPAADLVATDGHGAVRPDLARDLGMSPRIRDLVRSELFATVLYSALCNTTWLHKATGTPWHCSWRSAGGLVADLRCEGNYLDWYCSMGEGLVDEQVLDEIGALGWELAAADPPEC
jgi:hypothetical protein